jgi:hypothetical protein
MKTSATILATITLGAMLATGSATVSMAQGGFAGGFGVDVHAGGFGGGYHGSGDVHVGGFGAHMHGRGFRGSPGYYDPSWDYGTDAATYCSFDVVTPRYVGPNGIWHYCP